MKLWTVQSKEVLHEINISGVYTPDFNSYYYKNHYFKNTYKYILDIYNMNIYSKYTRGKRAKGLIFGITKFEDNLVESYEDYYNTLIEFDHSGITKGLPEHYLLELEIDDDKLLNIDFFRYSDVLFYLDIEPDITEANKFKDIMFTENDSGIERLVQSNYHKITKNSIVNIYPALIQVENNNIIESSCEYLNYFKHVLLRK
ncbi:MAG: hypothetical protein ACRDD7_16700 [Peptostreptococcaceae bacterium]